MTNWRQLASEVAIPHQAFVDGRTVAAVSGATYETSSPVDGRRLATVAACDAQDIDAAVRSARIAFDSGVWSQRAPSERKRTLLRIAEMIERHADELALLDTLSMGVPVSVSRNVCTSWAIQGFQWYGEAIDKIYDEIAPTDQAIVAQITREPVGVVGIVLPWNWPMGLLGWKLPPALAAGNSVVLKPDEKTSFSALRVAQLAVEAGLPPGVLNVVTGGAGAGAAIGLHPDVDTIAFTGSSEVGRKFMSYSGSSNMKSVWLECGGKGPNIVFGDAENLTAIAQTAAEAIFINSGQVCAAGSRLILQEDIADALLEKVCTFANHMQPGDPLDPATLIGSMASEAHTVRVEGYINIGRQEGARLVAGGRRVRGETGGCYLQPTVFDRVAPQMRIAQEEIFGPVLSVMRFRTVEEAIRMANESCYGLAGAIWTKNLATTYKVSKAIRAGSVAVNTYAEDAHSMLVPFGGYKLSGFGRDKSLHALDKYTQLKTTWIRF